MFTLRILPLLVAAPSALAGQGGLDRPPNVSGDWVVPPGTVQFNFLHRFIASPEPQRKVTNFPTFLAATSFYRTTTLGLNYATNSTLTPSFPNEWEFFLRWRPLSQETGFPLDVGVQAGWNVAADGADGDFSVARRLGRLRLIATGRALTDPADGDGWQLAFGGGGAVRITRHISIVGDVVRLTEPDESRGEETAWSAGVALGIPTTPHSLTLHATNTNTGTLQGSSRGDGQVRYGFEFTLPITLSRYFRRSKPGVDSAGAVAGEVPGGPVSAPVVTSPIRDFQFIPDTLRIPRGTTLRWVNQDVVLHTVTGAGGRFDSGLLAQGEQWLFTFTEAGSYAFSCTTHPFMHGLVVVR